ncbi:MAG TPA: DNA recombination protein RmuC [Stellaceae bacterium]|nr:DNA recombination protein RmuC [Stellaceae bacterium]
MEIMLFGLLSLAVLAGAVLFVRNREAQRRVAAETRLGEVEKRVTELTQERDSAAAARLTAETELATTRQQLAESRSRMAEFERVQQEMLISAKAALLEGGSQLSSKLLEDHKRENAESKEAAEKRVQAASETFLKQFETLSNAVAALEGRIQENGRVIDTVWRSLSNPSGAGQLAELGLANTLKAFGLEQGRDFQLQFSTQDEEGRRLRPDAVVFLPSSGVMVIDSKASKYLLEIAASEGTPGEEEAYRNLARTMNQHLRALGEKDYASAIRSSWRESGRSDEIARTVSVMYLPNEAALDKLNRADAEFLHTARARGIYLAGPTTLHCLISLASAEINLMRQVENQQRIVAAAEALLDGLTNALGHVADVGKSLNRAADAFGRFATSTNRFVISRAKKLAALGLQPAKPLPQSLPLFSVTAHETLIEGEAEEVRDSEPLRKPRLISE